MLAEIAVANAAFGVIKNAISNGQELHSVATQVTSYFDSKSSILTVLETKFVEEMTVFAAHDPANHNFSVNRHLMKLFQIGDSEQYKKSCILHISYL